MRIGRVFIHLADEDGVMEGGVGYTTLLEDEQASLESSWENTPTSSLSCVTYLFIIYLRGMFPLDRAVCVTVSVEEF